MYGLPSPEFYEERDSLKIVFRNSSIMTKEVQGGQVRGQVGGQVSGQVSSAVSIL